MAPNAPAQQPSPEPSRPSPAWSSSPPQLARPLQNLTSSVAPGDLITLACALAFAFHLLVLARTAPGIDSGLLATLQIAAATLFMLFSLPLEHPHATFTPRLIATLLLCGLLATAAAFTIQSYAQQHLPPTHTVVLLALEPVFAWLTSLVFLHESLGRRSLLGAALILLGIAIIEFLPTTHSTEIPRLTHFCVVRHLQDLSSHLPGFVILSEVEGSAVHPSTNPAGPFRSFPPPSRV